MNVKQIFINTLTAAGYTAGKTLFLQSTINPEETYPSEFVTFWTDYTSDISHFDNAVHSIEWNFTVILYADDPTVVNEKPEAIISALRNAGFIPQGVGQDIPSDSPSHTGWAMEFIYPDETKFN